MYVQVVTSRLTQLRYAPIGSVQYDYGVHAGAFPKLSSVVSGIGNIYLHGRSLPFPNLHLSVLVGCWHRYPVAELSSFEKLGPKYSVVSTAVSLMYIQFFCHVLLSIYVYPYIRLCCTPVVCRTVLLIANGVASGASLRLVCALFVSTTQILLAWNEDLFLRVLLLCLSCVLCRRAAATLIERLCCSLPSLTSGARGCGTWPCGRAESAFHMLWRQHLRYVLVEV